MRGWAQMGAILLLGAMGCQRNRAFQRPYLFDGQAAQAAAAPGALTPGALAGSAPAGAPAAPPQVSVAQAPTIQPAPAGAAPVGPSSEEVAAVRRQLGELSLLAERMERDNEDLNRRMAQTQQRNHILEDQLSLLQDRLGETTSQLQQTQVAREQTDEQMKALLASTRQRGATLTANNSVQRSLTVVQIPGLEVRQDKDTIRIAVPADRLFQPGGVEWTAGASVLLDQVADAVVRNYPRQLIAIEGHTDSSVIGLPGGNQQLAASQALAVYQHFTQKNRIAPRSLFTMAFGASQPRVSNATDAGRAQNRRVELVIYPENAP